MFKVFVNYLEYMIIVFVCSRSVWVIPCFIRYADLNRNCVVISVFCYQIVSLNRVSNSSFCFIFM